MGGKKDEHVVPKHKESHLHCDQSSKPSYYILSLVECAVYISCRKQFNAENSCNLQTQIFVRKEKR